MKRFILILSLVCSFLFSRSVYAEVTSPRISGENRFETAIAISNRSFDRARNAIIANGIRFVDALAGSTLANAQNAPILLTEEDALPNSTRDKLRSLGVEKVTILGGERTVSFRVEASLKAMGIEVKRISGENRYKTSEAIARAVSELRPVKEIMVAKSEADAVSSSAFRGAEIPLVLTDGQNPSPYLLNTEDEIILVGGTASISRAYEDKLKAKERIWGSDRYETAIALAKKKPATGALIVNDLNFIDAFTASTLAYHSGRNVLLSAKETLNPKTAAYLIQGEIDQVELIGGLRALSYDVSIQAQNPESVIRPDLNNQESYAYWNHYNRYDTDVLMTPAQIEAYNLQIQASQRNQNPSMQDVLALPQSFKGSEVLALIRGRSKAPSDNRYDADGKLYRQSFYDDLIQNMNLQGIPKTVTNRFGVTLNRSVIRTFPTHAVSKPRPDSGLDYFQETALAIWEPVCAVHDSKDGAWTFVLTYNYAGWMPAEDIAYGDKETLATYVKTDNFALITDPQIMIEEKKLDMGARLPLASPAQDGDRELEILLPQVEEGLLRPTIHSLSIDHASIAYLPYTTSNIVRQALKLNGAVYGWGGMNNSRDCSALVVDVYRTFGILLPRNTGQQVTTPGQRLDFSKVSDKSPALKKMKAGSALYMPGHVMLYLGQDDQGISKVIHAFGGYYQKGQYQSIDRTMITSTAIQSSDGTSFLSKTSTAITFER